MDIGLSDFLTALGLMLFIEGALYALFPVIMRKSAAEISKTPDHIIRGIAFVIVIAGVFLIWIVRS